MPYSGMGRTRKKIDMLGEAPKLLERLKTQKPGWQRERMIALKLVLAGEATQATADTLGRSQATIQSWINKFRAGGLEGLLDKRKGNGPQSRLTPEMEAAMIEELKKGHWRTARDAWNWLKENFEVGDLKEPTIYKYLGKCEGRLKATRPCNPKKDQAAEDEFRVTLANKMEALKIDPAKNVRLWVYDEMRYGLHPLTRKMWCLKGVRAIAPSRRRYLNAYLYGALEVGGSSSSEFLFTPTLNKQWDSSFLQQISKSGLDDVHVVIGDGAGFHHRDTDGELPHNVKIITLPAYSPELNPAEKLWDIVKDGICNIDWPNLRALEDKITERIKPYWEDTNRVVSLIGQGYLLSELNATFSEVFLSNNY